MSRRQLTQKQHTFLQFLREHVDTHHVWPTYREIVDHFEYRSPNSVTQNLHALSRKGFLRRGQNGYSLVETTGEDGSVAVRARVGGGGVESDADRLTLAALFPDAEGLHAVRIDRDVDRPAELEDATYVFLDASEGETVVLVGEGRLALGHVGPDGEIDVRLSGLESPQVLGTYVGHAGPHGLVCHRAPLTEAA